MDYRRAGSFRQRARNAEQTTRQLKEHRRQRVAVRTHEAIQEFEEHLRTVQDNGIDDLPMDAEAGHLREHSRRLVVADRATSVIHKDTSSDASSSMGRGTWMQRSLPELHSRSGGLDVDPRCDQRPPSPLAMYDYGAISTKPRSLLAQRWKEAGDSTRPAYRQSTAGLYFPGAQFRQGPYGFSMLDPIHMPHRSWEGAAAIPSRWPRDAGDLRPATAEAKGFRHVRGRTAGPMVSETVRSTVGHDRRAALAFRAIDKRSEEQQLEQVRFEHGVLEGRWRDPLLDPAVSVHALAPAANVRCDFLAEDTSDAPRAVQVASRILYGVEAALRADRGNMRRLFAAVNRGTPGVLEPEEFLEGLVRVGVVQDGELSPDNIIEAIAIVDPNFDGRVNFSMLERAVAAARAVHLQRSREARRVEQRHVKKMTNSYHETLPIDVVKVEREPKSLFDFERSFQRFQRQQKELLAHHGEPTH